MICYGDYLFEVLKASYINKCGKLWLPLLHTVNTIKFLYSFLNLLTNCIYWLLYIWPLWSSIILKIKVLCLYTAAHIVSKFYKLSLHKSIFYTINLLHSSLLFIIIHTYNYIHIHSLRFCKKILKDISHIHIIYDFEETLTVNSNKNTSFRKI